MVVPISHLNFLVLASAKEIFFLAEDFLETFLALRSSIWVFFGRTKRRCFSLAPNIFFSLSLEKLGVSNRETGHCPELKSLGITFLSDSFLYPRMEVMKKATHTSRKKHHDIWHASLSLSLLFTDEMKL